MFTSMSLLGAVGCDGLACNQCMQGCVTAVKDRAMVKILEMGGMWLSSKVCILLDSMPDKVGRTLHISEG